MKADILAPGLIVTIGSSIDGGVSYDRRNRKTRVGRAGERIDEWDTRKLTRDPAEHRAAEVARSAAVWQVEKLCAKTRHGILLCPPDREERLDEQITEARRIVGEFNRKARFTSVSLVVYKGYMPNADEKNAEQIASELQSLLAKMQAGVLKLDTEAIRDAAKRAKRLEQVLDTDPQRKLSAAIRQARTAAREITRKVEKLGIDGERVLRELKTEAIESARFAFLDLDEQATELDTDDLTQRPLPSYTAQEFAELDFSEGAVQTVRPIQDAPQELD